ncbi:hypothetical protein Pan44_08110 [Caulifigura coniformis]|uniref:Uncharacterized protein n=1 Tax=Caulifigura coniformis TaxID=2527983 RepID=A0A517S9J3_9PLAN|nr:hypothetical protein [Caulifigura coniformis]QDT52799.1 hypothetical protein Pan44_08110 [Caulifigura coniformis]
MKTNNSNKAAPVFEQRLHQIRISVWENTDGNGRTFFNTSLVRRYQAGQEWKESNQLTGASDVILAIEGLRMALDFVRKQDAGSRGQYDSGE